MSPGALSLAASAALAMAGGLVTASLGLAAAALSVEGPERLRRRLWPGEGDGPDGGGRE